MCYQFFLKKDEGVFKTVQQIDAGDVAVKAKSGDKTAKKALLWCYKIYLRMAKQIATSLQCDSLLMTLDNQVKNAWFVDAVSEQLKEEFYNFIRPEWLNRIRVFTQIKSLNFNILGNDLCKIKLKALTLKLKFMLYLYC